MSKIEIDKTAAQRDFLNSYDYFLKEFAPDDPEDRRHFDVHFMNLMHLASRVAMEPYTKMHDALIETKLPAFLGGFKP